MGVVGSVTPVTNPIATPMGNSMFALKGRNAIIVAPHPTAKGCTAKTIELIVDAITPLGAPENLVQIIREPSMELTKALMESVDVVVATGGAAMVKAAYGSGKPAYGVGPGNVQVILDRDIDFTEAAKKIITGRKFDNGIICSSEQAVIYHHEDREKVLKAFTENGALYIDDPAQADALRRTLFDGKLMNKRMIGQSIAKIAAAAEIPLAEGKLVIFIPSDGTHEDVLRREKMFPVLAGFEYSNLAEAIAIANENLYIEGQGHSCAVHSNNQATIETIALGVNTSRVVVNQPSSLSAGGSYFNGFAPTTTLGCGSWGNNSISENLDYKHLINIQRIGMPIPATIPGYEELWS
jgi:succinate-semialdehyde dehydrogenase